MYINIVFERRPACYMASYSDLHCQGKFQRCGLITLSDSTPTVAFEIEYTPGESTAHEEYCLGILLVPNHLVDIANRWDYGVFSDRRMWTSSGGCWQMHGATDNMPNMVYSYRVYDVRGSTRVTREISNTMRRSLRHVAVYAGVVPRITKTNPGTEWEYEVGELSGYVQVTQIVYAASAVVSSYVDNRRKIVSRMSMKIRDGGDVEQVKKVVRDSRWEVDDIE
jgi:hypothetical protein